MIILDKNCIRYTSTANTLTFKPLTIVFIFSQFHFFLAFDLCACMHLKICSAKIYIVNSNEHKRKIPCFNQIYINVKMLNCTSQTLQIMFYALRKMGFRSFINRVYKYRYFFSVSSVCCFFSFLFWYSFALCCQDISFRHHATIAWKVSKKRERK